MKYKSLSHSLSSLSFTLIPVIHTLPVRLSPPIPLSLFLSCLPSFTPPAQGTGDLQITTLSMLSASHGRKAPLIQARTHTHTLPGMQCHAGCPCVSSSCRVFPVCLPSHERSGTWLRFIRREQVRQGRELGELTFTFCSFTWRHFCKILKNKKQCNKIEI